MKEGNLLLQPHATTLRRRVYISNHFEEFTAFGLSSDEIDKELMGMTK